MYTRIKKKFISTFLSKAEFELRSKENGFTNIIIRHSTGVFVVHPIEEKGHFQAETGYEIESSPCPNLMKQIVGMY